MTVTTQQPKSLVWPRIQIRNLKKDVRIPWNRPLTFLIMGTRLTGGKSSLGETCAVRYPKIFDIFGSTDNEGLAWCKPEYKAIFQAQYGREPRILLLHGEGIQVAATQDKRLFNKISLHLFDQYDIIIVCRGFYLTEDKYFKALAHLTQLLWDERNYYTEVWFVLIREAANWIYARMKVVRKETTAKADFIKALREAYHSGLAVCVDTIRWTNIDKEVRDLANVLFIKRLGNAGLPRDLWWLYKYSKYPDVFKELRPDVFYVIAEREAVGYGRFDYPPWHKERRENILKSTGIEIQRIGQKPDVQKYSVTDLKHARMIKKYFELGSVTKVGEDPDVQKASKTVAAHIHSHNEAIKTKEECPRCHNASCEYSKTIVVLKLRGIAARNARRVNKGK